MANVREETSETLPIKVGQPWKEASNKMPEISPEFPNAKTLLISTKRPRSFLERTARELLAGGVDVIVLSALGEAIILCVQLQIALEEKKAATIIKIQTTFNPLSTEGNSDYTPGLRIYMRKHPDFKGSRISPGFVVFSSPNEKSNYTDCYDSNVNTNFASVNAGDQDLYVGGKGINAAFKNTLESSNIDCELFTQLHEKLWSKTIEEFKNKETNEIKSLIDPEVSEVHPGVRLALCRPGEPIETSKNNYDKTGSVFISVFKDNFPLSNNNNLAMVYLVGPDGKDYSSKESFLDAVYSTAVNLMTALCDFNGYARRIRDPKLPKNLKKSNSQSEDIIKISYCRVCLFSGGSFLYPQTTKLEVASMIVKGLNDAYRHGTAPRLNFAHDDDVFKQAWNEMTGM